MEPIFTFDLAEKKVIDEFSKELKMTVSFLACFLYVFYRRKCVRFKINK